MAFIPRSNTIWLAVPAFLAGFALLVPSGCAPEPWGNEPGTIRSDGTRQPDPASLDEALRVLERFAAAAEPGMPEGGTDRRHSPRGRFRDVRRAMIWAVEDGGVEMGVRRIVEFDWGFAFELKTVEGWPALAEVRRTDDTRVYEISVSVSRFPDRVESKERAQLLVEAFERWMQHFGAHPIRED